MEENTERPAERPVERPPNMRVFPVRAPADVNAFIAVEHLPVWVESRLMVWVSRAVYDVASWWAVRQLKKHARKAALWQYEVDAWKAVERP